MQQELDDFFNSLSGTYSKSALSQQRSKLKAELFIYLNNFQTDYYYSKASGIKKWKGFRLVAIDGSTLQLPYSNELVDSFGHFETRTENNRKVVLARISQAYDVMNNISIDAQIEHYRTSELSLATMHLPVLSKDDLLIMDRAYAAFWLMATLVEQERSFLIRVKANRWKLANQFLKSSLNEQIVTIKPSNEAVARCKEKNISPTPLKLRFIRVPIQSGEDHVLITDLTDQQEFQYSELKELYRKRWPIEESFKHLKLRAELENLSGKTTLTVRQDFFRIIVRANLAEIISKKLTNKAIRYINKKRKRKYQINRTQAYRKVKDIINTLLRHPQLLMDKLLKVTIQLITQAEILRPNRTVQRVRRYAARPANFMAYKP